LPDLPTPSYQQLFALLRTAARDAGDPPAEDLTPA
jgi:hypothetical protein